MRLDTGGSAREKRAFGVFGVLVDLGREALFGCHCRFGSDTLAAVASSQSIRLCGRLVAGRRLEIVMVCDK